MAGNFWQSSHCKQWLLTEEYILSSRRKDLLELSNEEYQKIMIFFANVIQAIGEQVKVRQQVIATATVYFRRFYARYPLKSCDPILLAPTCIYLASKVEEFGPISNTRLTAAVKNIVKGRFNYAFQSDYHYHISQLLECEFFLLELTDCCLVVYHPYRSLVQYVNQLNLGDSLLPVAWSIVNDSYRTDAILIYPPYQIALACLHMACVVQNVEAKARDWFAELNVDIDKIMEITQMILSFYELWKNNENNEKAEMKALIHKMPKAVPKKPIDAQNYQRGPR